MKRFILTMLIMLGIALSANAQQMNYRAQNFAIARVYNGTYQWGAWQKSSILITIDCDNDKIYVYSKSPQIYRVYSTSDTYRDRDGGQQIKFYVIDQDGDRGTIRLRIQSDGTSQIYVDFNDVAWCYGNIIRID